MVLFPGCACCGGGGGGGGNGPCEYCQEFCGYQVTVDKTETADDMTDAFIFTYDPSDLFDDPQITPGKTIAGPSSCAAGYFADRCEFFSDGGPPVPTGGKNYYVIESSNGLHGQVQSRSTSTLRNSNRGVYWVTDAYSWKPSTQNATTVTRLERVDLEWAIMCYGYYEVVDGVLTSMLTVALLAKLTQSVLVDGNGEVGSVVNNPLPGQSPYDPPYIFDGEYENEWPRVNRVRVREMEYILATSCREPDALTAACRASADPVIDWRPAYVKVTAEDDGITLTLPSGVTFYSWQTDDMVNDVAQWDEYEFDASVGSEGQYVHVFKREPDGESYFDPHLPLEKIEWETNFLSSTSGSPTVTISEFCNGGLTPLTATEAVIEVDEDTPLPLGEEQAAYVNAYDSFSPAMDPCVLSSYPAWSVYWKTQHLLITDMATAWCGDIPAVTTFTVWFYIDGLINDEETNYIGGTPVNGFVMAVRSWNVTIVAGQPPVVTQATSSSPCSATGEMPYCDDAIPAPSVTYGEP